MRVEFSLEVPHLLKYNGMHLDTFKKLHEASDFFLSSLAPKVPGKTMHCRDLQF